MWRRIRNGLGLVVALLAVAVPAAAQMELKRLPYVNVRLGLSSAVNAVAFSADGKHVLSGGYNNVVALWDTTTGLPLRTFDANSESVNTVAFSPACCQVLAGGYDRQLRVWDMRTGQLGAIMTGHTGEVLAAAFSPDGRQVVSGAKDQTIRLWDTLTGIPLSMLAQHTGAVTALAFSPDGRHLVSGSDDKMLILWDAATGQAVKPPLAGHTDGVTAVAFSPDGRLIASGGKDKTLRLWGVDADAGGPPRLLGEHAGEILSVAFSRDGRKVLTASRDKTLKIWDVATGQLVRTLSDHKDIVTSAVFSPDGRRVLSGSWDKTLKLWNADTGQPESTIDVSAPTFAPNGHRFLYEGKPLPNTPDLARLTERLQERGFKRGDPVFLRVFKADLQVELWMKRAGAFELFATYPICAWSGELGPKETVGDFQSPEGFYSIARDQLNPNSRFHRAFNLGYPNAFDRAFARTGANLMIHGNCKSVGCYAMTDAVIDELWQLVTAALDGGQERVGVHVFPFRMTEARLAAYRWHPASEFWRDLKRGYDLFEADRVPPQVSVCNKRYVVRRGEAGARSVAAVQASCSGS